MIPQFDPSFQMRSDFDQEKKRAVNVATRSLERDLERLKADHNTELEELQEQHNQQLSENKKKQWVSWKIERTYTKKLKLQDPVFAILPQKSFARNIPLFVNFLR